jgi:hypothetical protein
LGILGPVAKFLFNMMVGYLSSWYILTDFNFSSIFVSTKKFILVEPDMMLEQSQKAVEIFYSYALEDKQLCRELESHLSALKQAGIISNWHAQLVEAGINRESAPFK